jgi:phage terminase large subunit-like protein
MADSWNLACPDWEDRLRAGRSLIPALPLFTAEAEMAVQFFDQLRLPDVPGNPTMKEAAGDWFRDIVATLFGSRDPESNTRHIEEIFALIAKKNSKTTNGAGLMIAALLMNIRPLAEFMFVGPTQAISDLAYTQAEGMIKLDPELDKRFHIKSHTKEIVDRLNGAKLKIKTFDLDILTGPRPAGVLLDELHLLGKDRNAQKVIRQLRGGRQATPEGFLVFLTTQSDEPPAGAFREELMMARAIRDGRAKGNMLPILYEFPDAIARDQAKPPAWQDPRHWPMVLPNLGRSLRLDALIKDFEGEKQKGEAAIRIWASQHLNIEIGLALRSDRWEGADHWEPRVDRSITLKAMIERCDIIVVGLDGGGLDDLLGFAAIGRDAKTRDWLHWGHAWAHESVLERRKEIAPALHDFVAEGSLTIVATPGDDVLAVAALVMQIADAGLLPEKNAVGVDPAGITEIVDELEQLDITAESERIVGIRQGWTLSNTIKTTARRLAAGTLLHAGQRLMAWSVGNARVEPKGNAALITKQASGSAKIDPLMALFNAAALMAKNPEPAGSVYGTSERPEGLLVL